MRSQESTRSRRFLLIILLTTSFLMEMKVDRGLSPTSFYTATRKTPCGRKFRGRASSTSFSLKWRLETWIIKSLKLLMGIHVSESQAVEQERKRCKLCSQP